MPLYTPTTWVNATTALSAANMNNIEAGIVAAVRADGSLSFTATEDFVQALAGADKTYWRIVPTGDKTYAAMVRNSDKAFLFKNTTDGNDLLILGPGAGVIKSGTNTIWHAGNDGAGSGLDADLLDGLTSGNGSGNVPISNGTVNTNLNADMVDGRHDTAFPLVGSGGGFANRTIGVGPIGSRPAAGNKGAVYIETPFS